MSRPRRDQYLPNTYAIDAALIDYAYLSLIAVVIHQVTTWQG